MQFGIGGANSYTVDDKRLGIAGIRENEMNLFVPERTKLFSLAILSASEFSTFFFFSRFFPGKFESISTVFFQ